MHPLDDEDVAVLVEPGIVRMDELARLALLRRLAHLEAIERLLAPFGVVAEVNDRLVVLAEERNASVQVRHHEDIAANAEGLTSHGHRR